MTASSRAQQARIDPLPSGAAQLNHIVCLFPDPSSLLPDSATAEPTFDKSVITSLIATKEVGNRIHGLRLPQTCYGVLHVMNTHTHRPIPSVTVPDSAMEEPTICLSVVTCQTDHEKGDE